MAVLEVVTPGLMASVQDDGRPGWRRFGIPPGGAMDRRSAHLANHLIDNPPGAAVLECLQGTRLIVLEPADLAMAGRWGGRAWRANVGDIVDFPASLDGVWHYLAVPGGLSAARFLGSASVCARAGIGTVLGQGDRLDSQACPAGRLPPGVRSRHPSDPAMPDDSPLRLWPGPQWADFGPASHRALLNGEWRVSARSDRTGYRLEGEPLTPPPGNLASEPVRVGSVQVPPDGQPIVTLHDGPTVGGYAKIALIDAGDLDRLVQTRPGRTLRFRRAE